VGQKTNPLGMRLGIVRTWDSRWFARKDYPALLKEDIVIRRYLKKRLSQAGVSRIVISRTASKVTINISTARRRFLDRGIALDDDQNVARALEKRRRAALRPREEPLHRRSRLGDRLLHVHVLDVDLPFHRHGIRNGRLHDLADDLGDVLRSEIEDLGDLVDPLAADQLQHLVRLPRRHPYVSRYRSCFHVVVVSRLGWGAATSPQAPRVPPPSPRAIRDRGRSAWPRTRPVCVRPCFP